MQNDTSLYFLTPNCRELGLNGDIAVNRAVKAPGELQSDRKTQNTDFEPSTYNDLKIRHLRRYWKYAPRDVIQAEAFRYC